MRGFFFQKKYMVKPGDVNFQPKFVPYDNVHKPNRLILLWIREILNYSFS